MLSFKFTDSISTMMDSLKITSYICKKILTKPVLIPIALILAALLPPREASAGEYAQGIGAGMHFFTGAATGSLTGSNGYSVNFGAEKNKGFIRPSLAAVIQYSSGTASLTSTTADYTLYSVDFLAGFKIFALSAGLIQPFIGADGVVGTGILKLPAAVATTDANTLGFSYGFVVSTGVNIARTQSGNLMRIQGQYWYLNSSLGGLSSFNLGGFRFTIGLIF